MAATSTPRNRFIGVLVALFVLTFASSVGWTAYAADAKHEVVKTLLETKDGIVEIDLWADVAPKHVAQITTLIEEGFYDGIVFHRVIDGFMAQTGDPTGTGMGGSELPDIPAEFSDEKYVRGTLGMARSQNPNSGNSQFFITFGDAAFLEGQYTVFGKVTAGMDFIDSVKKGDPQSGMMDDPDKIVSFRLAE